MRVKTKLIGKASNLKNLEEIEKEIKRQSEWIQVKEKLELTKEEYDYLIENLLVDIDKIAELNGVTYITDGKREIVVDNQGYKYARYTGIIEEKED